MKPGFGLVRTLIRIGQYLNGLERVALEEAANKEGVLASRRISCNLESDGLQTVQSGEPTLPADSPRLVTVVAIPLPHSEGLVIPMSFTMIGN
jgi:hypothetical protein